MKKMMFIAAIAMCAMACGTKATKCDGKCEGKCEQQCEQKCDSTCKHDCEQACADSATVEVATEDVAK
ncbi:MAG: hypothetical protein MJZ84_06970 [Paludibacteraceae bacterium]|nr:hypothetical protein [Paludibacteraceae bacterium]